MAKKREHAKREQLPARLAPKPPRTGVGTPDEHVAPAGVSLGGDTGDVGTPRDQLGGTTGDAYGTSSTPEWSTVWQGDDKPVKEKRAS
ncbi:MAG: hypothetical protein ACYDCO_12165 [Armatimonadota bacterium]